MALTTPKTFAQRITDAIKSERTGVSELNSHSVDEMITALTDAGRIEPVDSAIVQMARSLATAVDEEPYNAPLWGRYQDALEMLRELDSGDDDEFAALLAEMQASMGNPEDA